MAWVGIRKRHISLAMVAGGIGDPVLRLRFLRAVAPQKMSGASRSRRTLRRALGLFLPLLLIVSLVIKLTTGKPTSPITRMQFAQHNTPLAAARPSPMPAARQGESVWQIETSADSEVYSNGLRVDKRYATSGDPRSYLAFPRNPTKSATPVQRSQPAGIVFHSTESCQAPFEAEQTTEIKRLGRGMLEYVRLNRSYNYVIDRFGRVYRVVAEPDIAYHAGHSVWADDDWLYVDLNRSFLGIAFEAETNSGRTSGLASEAQLRAGEMLTEMLRSRYRIPPGNCVTHAQVSVNPSNMLIGYHTDWAAGFPFEAVGLPDNYQRPLPALWAFGFGYEPVWLDSGSSLASGIERAEVEILRAAAAAGVAPDAYRKTLQRRYREKLAEMRVTPASPPPGDTRSQASPAAPPQQPPAVHKRRRPPAHAGK